ncbi:DUF3422 family protein [Beggiatoa leptomitoformis]|uniref:DUF3422 family protein n=1 Tax=Beggiatoa leptomitoformis TaxID=288004 RepID=A0A2N9YJE5_9GAMM|nr:DUF3422 domain-containing protein [Beggiatoa leptomitoformis]ALG67437.1 DUF3422 family protein [Beggiatoa leptomitoformis]AUI70346.1 DUF3422 family protein [Beggiatoa leptomitoformis]
MPSLPPEYPQRSILHNEVHARPFEALHPPERASYLALLVNEQERQREWSHLIALCEQFGYPPPSVETKHFSGNFGAFRLHLERHTEFTRYQFIVKADFTNPFADPVINLLPDEWVKAIPGQLMVAAHLAILKADSVQHLPTTVDDIVSFFEGNHIVGAHISDGAGLAFTDFTIHADGFSRFLIVDKSMYSRQCGRMMLRLLEIETYRMMAFMALPLARDLIPVLAEADKKLVTLTTAMTQAQDKKDEELLEELSQLATMIENIVSSTAYRFSATEAYYELVARRIIELREVRIQGVQTFQEFMDRRLAPAIRTCESVASRQDVLSKRINNASQLLRTRVEIKHEEQNRALLASMDNRAHLQLRLQETVEGLSVAAITYYAVSLVGYIAKALKSAELLHVNPEIVMGISIPIIALLIASGVRHIRKSVTEE